MCPCWGWRQPGRPSPAQSISVSLFSPPPNPAHFQAPPAERAAFLLLRPTAPGSQAEAGAGSRFGMLNIKQAKPGVSGPEATRASLQGSRESPRVYVAGWRVRERRKGGDAVCKISPTLRSRRCLGWVGCLGRGAQLLPNLGANCAAPTRGEASGSSGTSAPVASPED